MRSSSPMRRAIKANASIWSATTGVDKSPRAWRTGTPSGLPRSPSCRGRIPNRSVARLRKRTATRSIARAIIAPSSIPRPASTYWRTTRGACATACSARPSAALDDHLSVLGNPAAMEAALAWYRANKGLAADIGAIKVPTLYLWGDNDATVGPDAAHGTAEFIAAAFAMEVLPGIGHFVMDQAPAKATDLMLAHIRKHPV